jgi:hypothetical protein
MQSEDISNPDLMRALDAMAHQAGLVVITVYVIQWLKRARWFPWLSANSDRVTRWVSTGAALGTALFVQGTISITSGDASTGWHFTGSTPSLHALYDGFIRFAAQRAGQEWMFQNVVKKPKEVTLVPAEKDDAAGKPIDEHLVVSVEH